MTDQIVEKLNKILTKKKFSEPIVVYVMAGIRKIIEQQPKPEAGSEDPWKALKLYCNWVLHPKLDHKPAQEFTKHFEGLYQGIIDKKETKLYKEAVAISKFKVFRTEMSKILKHFHIYDFTENDDVWHKFKLDYSCVIADCPLEAKSNNDNDFIKQIVVSVQKAEKDGQLVFQTRWNIIPKLGDNAGFSIYDSYALSDL